MTNKTNGIWIGENSVIAIAGELRLIFLRMKKDSIVSILSHDKSGVISVAYGHGDSWDNHKYTVVVMKNEQGELVKNNDQAADFITLHSADKLSYDHQNDKLIYTTHDGKAFENVLAEKVVMSDFERKNEIDNSLSVTEKMTRWSIGTYIEVNSKVVRAGIDTDKYSIFYAVDLSNEANEFIYCRVGQNGFCEKGRAMLPTIEIRHHLTRMIDDNLSSIHDYKPNEDWFVADGCTFPEDGGWYWSIKELTDDVIYLQGCSGDVYEIHRR